MSGTTANTEGVMLVVNPFCKPIFDYSGSANELAEYCFIMHLRNLGIQNTCSDLQVDHWAFLKYLFSSSQRHSCLSTPSTT